MKLNYLINHLTHTKNIETTKFNEKKLTLITSLVARLGPLDEKETTTGADALRIVVLLKMVAPGELLIIRS